MPQCPSNPHFYSWLKELRDDAREKDNKSYHCYSRAMKALCSYPIPLRSGEEAKSIQVGVYNFFPPNAFLRRRRKKALLRVNDRGGGWKMCILALRRVCVRARGHVCS